MSSYRCGESAVPGSAGVLSVEVREGYLTAMIRYMLRSQRFDITIRMKDHVVAETLPESIIILRQSNCLSCSQSPRNTPQMMVPLHSVGKRHLVLNVQWRVISTVHS